MKLINGFTRIMIYIKPLSRASVILLVVLPLDSVWSDDSTNSIQREYSYDGLLQREIIRHQGTSLGAATSIQVRAFKYDNKGRIIEKRECWGTDSSAIPTALVCFEYDDATGLLFKESATLDVDHDGQRDQFDVTQFSYLGPLLVSKVIESYPGTSTDCGQITRISFEYDANSQLSRESKIIFQPNSRESDAMEVKAFQYTAGLLTTLITTQFDGQGRPKQEEVARFAYSDSGLLASEVRDIDLDMDGTADRHSHVEHRTLAAHSGVLPTFSFVSYWVIAAIILWRRARKQSPGRSEPA